MESFGPHKESLERIDIFFTIIRFPFGVLGSLIVTVFYLAMTPFEFCVFMCWMPFAAVIATRTEFRSNPWVRRFPYFFREIGRRNGLIWKWVGND